MPPKTRSIKQQSTLQASFAAHSRKRKRTDQPQQFDKEEVAVGDEVRLDNDHHDHDDSASVKKRRKGKAAAAITVPRPPPSPTFEEKKLIHLEILRDFDLKTKFGACIGLTRLERWNRANKFNLSPPSEILSILNMSAYADDAEIQESMWRYIT